MQQQYQFGCVQSQYKLLRGDEAGAVQLGVCCRAVKCTRWAGNWLGGCGGEVFLACTMLGLWWVWQCGRVDWHGGCPAHVVNCCYLVDVAQGIRVWGRQQQLGPDEKRMIL